MHSQEFNQDESSLRGSIKDSKELHNIVVDMKDKNITVVTSYNRDQANNMV
jgi:hypothetical protein